MTAAPSTPDPPVSGSGALADVERAALACTRCGLAAARTQVVFGAGDPNADLMFIGEGPGEQEDLRGVPFVGRSGMLLTQLIEGIGLTRDSVYIANVVKCRPPGNRDPLAAEIEACSPWLDSQLELIRPRVIMTLGNFATKLLLDTKEGITKLRGRELALRRPGVAAELATVVVPTYHPAAVLRSGGRQLAEIRADFVKVKRLLKQATR